MEEILVTLQNLSTVLEGLLQNLPNNERSSNELLKSNKELSRQNEQLSRQLTEIAQKSQKGFNTAYDSHSMVLSKIGELNAKLGHFDKLASELKNIKQPFVLPNWWAITIATICFFGMIVIAGMKIFDEYEAAQSTESQIKSNYWLIPKDSFNVEQKKGTYKVSIKK
jgi:predicted PurR-regulated permease PerM